MALGTPFCLWLCFVIFKQTFWYLRCCIDDFSIHNSVEAVTMVVSRLAGSCSGLYSDMLTISANFSQGPIGLIR